jgi:RNA polymerase sigma factor (sigma-70 family)
MTIEDAEDAVHEAMLRAAENPHLDDERLGAWLTTVTVRICVDRYRQANREAEARTSPTLVAPGPVPVEEAVCDRAEARWLAVRSGELPARQAEALWLKSEDLDVGQVANKMGLSYRTVESLLARARRTLRNSLAATLSGAVWLVWRGRPGMGGNAKVVVVSSAAAATLTAAGFVLPYTHHRDSGSNPQQPGASQRAEAGHPGPGGSELPPAGGDGSSGEDRTAGSAGSGASPAGAPDWLPEISLPSLVSVPPVNVPSASIVPSIPLDILQSPQIDAPDATDIPTVPDTSALAGVPEPADVPAGRSDMPEEPRVLSTRTDLTP